MITITISIMENDKDSNSNKGGIHFRLPRFQYDDRGEGICSLTLHMQENDMLQNLWSVYLAYIVTLFALYFKQWS